MLQLMIHAHVEFKTGDSSYARLGVEIFGLLPGEIFFFLTTTSTLKVPICALFCAPLSIKIYYPSLHETPSFKKVPKSMKYLYA